MKPPLGYAIRRVENENGRWWVTVSDFNKNLFARSAASANEAWLKCLKKIKELENDGCL